MPLSYSVDRSSRGFTLVELLVVVVIIVALAAIAVPIFLNQKDKADGASRDSDMVSMSKLMSTASGTGGKIVVENDGKSLVYYDPDGTQSSVASVQGTFALFNSPDGVISTGSCVEIVFENETRSYAIPSGVGSGCS